MRNYLARHRGPFDVSTIRLLVDAFDEAWKSVKDSGAANATETAREALAKYMVDAAMLGERDHRRLCDGALQHVAALPKV